jgi:serine protease Do
VRVAHAAELCPFITALPLGQPTNGRLALGDCEFSVDESYVDVYEFTLTTAGTVQIDMGSTELDTYLGLFDATGPFIAEDDNSGGGTNAQIVRQLNAGRYRVWANTTTGATSGAYTLTVVQR